MILKRNFHPIKVLSYVWLELTAVLLSGALAYGLHVWGRFDAILPFSAAAILGSALAIFIAFRNNSSYARWWEARTLWGNISQACRVLGRLIITFTDSHAHQANYDKQRSESFKRALIYKLMAWAHALRLHLRGQNRQWQETLTPFLQPQDLQALESAHNKPNMLQLRMGKSIYEAMSDGTLGGFDSFQMEGQLLALAGFQAGCERIKNTPLLRQYHYFTRLFLYVFVLLLPFALLGDFVKSGLAFLTLPVSVLVVFVFAVLSKVGEANEDPFENRISDVPLTALCLAIERDLREMLGETELPETPKGEKGILF